MTYRKFRPDSQEPKATLERVLGDYDDATYDAALQDDRLLNLMTLRDGLYERESRLSRDEDLPDHIDSTVFGAAEDVGDAVEAYVHVQYEEGED